MAFAKQWRALLFIPTMKNGPRKLARYHCPIAESVMCRVTCTAIATWCANRIIIVGISWPVIANGHSGRKEGSMIRRVLAFVISRTVYVAPYLRWLAAEKIDLLIRLIHIQAAGPPVSACTDKLGIMVAIYNGTAQRGSANSAERTPF